MAVVRVEAARRDDFVEIMVSNTGIGIPRDQHEAVFDRYHQVVTANRTAPGGTGLGLSITRALVEHHGGRIWLESERGQGSRFTFTLPAAKSIAA